MLKMLQQSHLAKQLFCVLPLSTQVATATLYPFYCHNLTALLMILRSDELAKSASSNRSQNFVARMQTCELGYEGGMVGKKVVTPRTLHLCRCEFKKMQCKSETFLGLASEEPWPDVTGNCFCLLYTSPSPRDRG